MSAEHEEAILRLLEVTGSKQIGLQVATAVGNQTFDAIVGDDVENADAIRAIAQEEFDLVLREGMDDIMALMVPLYAKYFTLGEILELLEFYESPVGKKAIAVMPQLLQESIVIGQQWAEMLGPIYGERLLERLREEGFLDEELPEASSSTSS